MTYFEDDSSLVEVRFWVAVCRDEVMGGAVEHVPCEAYVDTRCPGGHVVGVLMKYEEVPVSMVIAPGFAPDVVNGVERIAERDILQTAKYNDW